MIVWREVAELKVIGDPKGQPRQRAFVRRFNNGTVRAGTYDPKVADDWKARVIQEAELHLPERPIDGPVRIDIAWYFPRPKRLMRRSDPDGCVLHTGKPDRDNCDKAVLDALTQIRFIADDKLVCCGTLEKWYHSKAGRPGAHIRISVPESVGAAVAEGDLFAEEITG